MLEFFKNINIYDVIAIFLFLLLSAWGYKKGFIQTVFKFVSLFLSAFIAVNLYPYMSSVLRLTPIYSSIQDSYKVDFYQKISSAANSATISYEKAVNALKLPGFFQSKLIDSSSARVNDSVKTVSEYLSRSFSGIIIDMIALLLLFVLIIVLLLVLKKILVSFGKLPVIRSFDRLLGTIIGVFVAVLIIYIGTCVIFSFAEAFDIKFLYREIARSHIGGFIIGKNIFTYFL